MSNTSIDIKKTPESRDVAPVGWQSLRHDLERLLNRFDGGLWQPSMRRMLDLEPFWRMDSSFAVSSPAVDVSEDEKAFKITAELPGLDEKNIDLSISGDQLILKGEKHQEKEEKDKNHYLSERSYGSFQRTFRLPDGVDQNKVAANFTKGILTITLPKTADAQKSQRKIDIKAA